MGKIWWNWASVKQLAGVLGGVLLDNILEFECEIEREVYNSPNYKVYGAYVNTNIYPFVKLNKYGNVTLVGNLHDLTVGVNYRVKAKQSENKYGIQYDVINIRRDLPKTKTETAKFLYEILTPNQADVLLEAYPDIVYKIINNDLDDVDLNKTKGIKEKTFEKIKTKVIENFALVELIEKYSGYGITISTLKKLYDHYTSIEKLEEELRDDPYKSLCGVSGIGFKKADNIILNIPKAVLDIDYDIKTSRQRMKSCMLYVLEQNEKQGHTKLDIRAFRNSCLELTEECIDHFVDIVKEDDDFYFDKATGYIATRKAYKTEKYIAETLLAMLKNSKPYDFNPYIYKDNGNFVLTDEQLNVLVNLCKYNVSLLVGAAGVGKTFTTQAVIKMLDDNNLTYLLLTPTGKSSDVLSKYTNREASTIHRGLRFNPHSGWEYNEYNKLPYDVVICDETGMVDIYLMKRLLEAIDTEKTKLLFIQDPAQLPSVRSGNCSEDMIQSNVIPKTYLTKVFRYGEGGLDTVATKIRKGEYYIPKTNDKVINFGINKDYSIIDMPQENMVDGVVNLYEKLVNDGVNVDDIMVLSHHNKGDYGSKLINRKIQQRINPIKNKKYIKYGQDYFIEGDKVLQIINNYKAVNIYDQEVAIYNGNTGTIERIIDDKNIIINFKDELIKYEKSDLEQLLLGYAMSIHKSQGDSCDYVILITPQAHSYFINRNLLYTGVTRTKKKCYHFTGEKIIRLALKKSVSKERKTFLREMLKK